MGILVDTNVIVDFLLSREPFCEASTRVINMCANGQVEGHVAFHSIPNLWYILGKVPAQKRREWLLAICEFLQVVGVGHTDVVKAITMNEFEDFEDCLQDRCAVAVGAEYIVTRNTKDFKDSSTPAVTPEAFLEMKAE